MRSIHGRSTVSQFEVSKYVIRRVVSSFTPRQVFESAQSSRSMLIGIVSARAANRLFYEDGQEGIAVGASTSLENHHRFYVRYWQESFCTVTSKLGSTILQSASSCVGLQQTLTFAAAHGLNVIFHYPIPSKVQAQAEKSHAWVFLAVLETYLRSRPAGSTHRVSVQYHDIESPMPRSVQEYLSVIRLGHHFEYAVRNE